MRAGRVIFDNGAQVSVEIPETAAEKAQGLAGRPWVPADRGMLFAGAGPMWMAGTLAALDMIALGPGGEVLAIVESAQPHTRQPRGPWPGATHVLEVRGGWARALGIGLGSRASIVSLL